MIHYRFENNSYISIKDIVIGISIGSEKNPLFGIYGRVWFIMIDLLFIHLQLSIVRSGNHKVGADKE